MAWERWAELLEIVSVYVKAITRASRSSTRLQVRRQELVSRYHVGANRNTHPSQLPSLSLLLHRAQHERVLIRPQKSATVASRRLLTVPSSAEALTERKDGNEISYITTEQGHYSKHQFGLYSKLS
jgi:hypothetical protein